MAWFYWVSLYPYVPCIMLLKASHENSSSFLTAKNIDNRKLDLIWRKLFTRLLLDNYFDMGGFTFVNPVRLTVHAAFKYLKNKGSITTLALLPATLTLAGSTSKADLHEELVTRLCSTNPKLLQERFHFRWTYSLCSELYSFKGFPYDKPPFLPKTPKSIQFWMNYLLIQHNHCLVSM